MPASTFKKSERLKSHKIIRSIFSDGHSFHVYPVRIAWIKATRSTSEFPVQFALSVSKRNFPTAVERNRIRRKLREAYRLNKYFLYEKLEHHPHQYALMMIYTGKEEMSYQKIEKSLQRILRKFLRKISADN